MKGFGKIGSILLLAISPLLGTEEYVVGSVFGQMGNCLFQVATASALAWDHGAEAYFPILAHTPTYCQHVFSRCKLFPPSEEISSEWHEPEYRYHPILYQPKIKVYGYFQSQKYFAHHREKLLALLAPTHRDLHYIQKKYDWLLESPHTVGVQIRFYGDDGQLFVQYGREYLQQAMAQFPPSSLFIVSSNNLTFAKENISGPNVLFLEEEPFYIDFYLLSLCKNIIITNSTFGWWAAWLNQNPEKKVICPAIWFKGYDTQDLCPEEWIKIAMEVP